MPGDRMREMALSISFPAIPPAAAVGVHPPPEDSASELDFRGHARIAGDFSCSLCDH